MKTKKLFSGNKFGWVLASLGSAGFLASLILSYEKLAVALNPDHIPSCSLNPVIDCGAAMQSGTDTLLMNIPNAYLGIGAFAALMAIGVAILAGARFKDWFWKLFYGITLIGLGITAFFIFDSLYVLGALCLYCMATWAAVIPLFIYSTIYLVEKKVLQVPKFLKKAWPVITNNHLGVVIVVYLTIFGLALFRFRDYFETVF